MQVYWVIDTFPSFFTKQDFFLLIHTSKLTFTELLTDEIKLIHRYIRLAKEGATIQGKL